MKQIILLGLFFINPSHAKLDTQKNCGLNQQAQKLAELIIKAKNQQRQKLVCDKQLALASYDKAQALAATDKIEHNVNHTTPNEFLKKHGIALPYIYETLGNQVEAINGGTENAQEAFDYFMTSLDHKAHILGENSFYQSQDKIGVGFFQDDTKNHEEYWVVYITEFRKDDDVLVKPHKLKVQFINQKKKKKRFQRGDTLERREYKFN